jgi:lipoprotein-anchoring transpeptidase ErfK/SrfK
VNALQRIGVGLGVAALGVASFAGGMFASDRLGGETASIVSQPVAVVSTVDSSVSGFAVEVPTTLWVPDKVKGERVFRPKSKAIATSMTPYGAGNFGVGITISVTFDDVVEPAMRKALERNAFVTASKPIGAAGWSWPTDRTMVFRPVNFWPAHTDVSFTTKWIEAGLTDYDPGRKFHVGRSLTLRISYDTNVGRLFLAGKKVREVPVSLGRPGLETWSGYTTVMEKYQVKRMINPQYNYDIQVPYAMRLSWDGIFLHAAPWNEHNLGVAATSHGCINVSYDEGKWWFENSLIGDVVTVTGPSINTPIAFAAGAAWNIPWGTWVEGAAAAP